MNQTTILLIDDDALLRSSCASVLAHHGYSVIEASDGDAALARLDEEPLPELIVVDLEMPGMGGWEFLAILRSDRRLAELPVLIVSALELGPRARAVYPSLRKLVEPEQLLATVAQLLHVARPSFG
jgi:CheY-like chemotaxis protein